jgi:hypothetical protein
MEKAANDEAERKWHEDMHAWNVNPAAIKDKGPKPVKPEPKTGTVLPVQPSANPAVDLFSLEPAIDYSNFQSIPYQPVCHVSYFFISLADHHL